MLPDYSVVGDPMERAGLITYRPLAGDRTAVSLVLRQRRQQHVPRAVRDLEAASWRRPDARGDRSAGTEPEPRDVRAGMNLSSRSHPASRLLLAGARSLSPAARGSDDDDGGGSTSESYAGGRPGRDRGRPARPTPTSRPRQPRRGGADDATVARASRP